MRLLAATALMMSMIPAAASAQVQDWVRVAGNDQMVAFVDAGSITRNGGKATAVTFSGYAKPLGETEIWFTAVKVEYNCSANTFRTLEYTYYAKDRRSLGTEASFTINEIRTPKPGSIDERFQQYTCNGTNGTPSTNPFRETETRFPR